MMQKEVAYLVSRVRGKIWRERGVDGQPAIARHLAIRHRCRRQQRIWPLTCRFPLLFSCRGKQIKKKKEGVGAAAAGLVTHDHELVLVLSS